MADKPSADPLAPWREMVSQWEKSMNALANRNMATDQFSGSMNQVLSTMLAGQSTIGEMMVKYLATLNLPSRADLIALGEQLGAIEAQLATIARILERQDRERAVKSPTPPRTKRPPAETE